MRKINQSTIKRVASRIICPQKYYRQEVTKEFPRKTTDAMLRGNFGEYIAFGTMPKSGDGSIPELPRHKKTGKPSVYETRIRAQVQTMFEIFKEQNMKVHTKDFYVEQVVANILFHGTNDVLLDWNGKPYIFDMKITGDCTSTYGSFAWGSYDRKHPMVKTFIKDGGFFMAEYDAKKIERGEIMDPLQAHSYQLLMEMRTNVPWGFLYGVFDYKKKPEWKMIEVPFSKDARNDTLRRLRETDEKLTYFENTNYEEIPHLDECSDCPVWNCSKRLHAAEDGSQVKFHDQGDNIPLPYDEDEAQPLF